MDVSRNVYSRDLKVAAMRAIDAGSTNAEVARSVNRSGRQNEYLDIAAAVHLGRCRVPLQVHMPIM